MQQSDLCSWHRLSWHQKFVCAAGALSLALLVSGYAGLPGLNVFGFDEVHYYADLGFKLPEEGRWLNFLLHDFLRSIPPGTWAVIFVLAAWTLFFRLGRSLQFDGPLAVLVASTLLLASPFVEQSLWPASIMPAVAVLLLTGILVERAVPYPLVYLFSGILLFGAVQSFYFLVPLFFLGQFLHPGGSNKHCWVNLARHLAWWVLGAIFGALVVFTVLWFKTGYFGIRPAAWRHTQPIHDIAGLIRNIEYVAAALWYRTVHVLKSAGVFSGWFAVGMGLIAIVRFRALVARPQAFMLLATVAAGFFVFSIPLAPIIEQRSVVALGAAFVVLIACLPGPSPLGRVIAAALLLVVSYGFSTYASSYLARHRAEADLFYYKLQQLIPGAPSSYASVSLFGLMSDGEPAANTFNSAYKMHGIFHALGVEHFRDCRAIVDQRCDFPDMGKPLAALPLGRGRLVFSVGEDASAFVHFQESAAMHPDKD